jgi:hypothetical protein
LSELDLCQCDNEILVGPVVVRLQVFQIIGFSRQVLSWTDTNCMLGQSVIHYIVYIQ